MFEIEQEDSRWYSWVVACLKPTVLKLFATALGAAGYYMGFHDGYVTAQHTLEFPVNFLSHGEITFSKDYRVVIGRKTPVLVSELEIAWRDAGISINGVHCRIEKPLGQPYFHNELVEVPKPGEMLGTVLAVESEQDRTSRQR